MNSPSGDPLAEGLSFESLMAGAREGRLALPQDGSRGVATDSETFAQRFFAGQNAVRCRSHD
jgi:hypothetical protein